MPPPEVKLDKNTEILSAYRESLSSLPKMDDLALDLQTCEAQKVQDLPMLDENQNQWNMIYRKMTEEGQSGDRYVLSLLRRDKQEGRFEDYNIKLTLFEITTGRQDVFVYTESQILSEE